MKDKIRWIISAAALIITVFGATAQTTNQNDTIILDRILAVVGGHPILQSDVEQALLTKQAQGIRIMGDEKCSVLEDLMASKLFLDQAELDSIEKTDREVEIALERKLDAFVQMAGSEEAIEKQFNKSMPEIKKDFFEDMKEQLQTEEIQATLTADVKITPSEVQKFFRDIPKEEIPRIPEQLEIRQIVLQPIITEEEKQRVIARLNDYREQILAGKSMATLAILHSDDPESRSRGGELGYVNRTDLVPEFTAAAFNLRGDEVSRVVKTDYGYHLIQVIDRKGSTINARHILLRPKVSEDEKNKARRLLDSLANDIRKGDIEFSEAATRFSADEQTKANGGLMVNMNTGSTKFEPRELDPVMLEQANKLKVGEVSEPFESTDDNMNTVYKIIMLESKQMAHQADIKTDYQQIQNWALSNKRNEALNEWISKKLKSTYVKINSDYQNCDFQMEGWVR